MAIVTVDGNPFAAKQAHAKPCYQTAQTLLHEDQWKARLNEATENHTKELACALQVWTM